MADIITRLLLKTNDFDANLNKSKGSVDNYQSGVSNMAKMAGSSFLKVAGGIGLVLSAGEGLNKVMNSSQTLSDEYSRTMDGLKEGVNQFFYSIGSGDWTPFMNGLADTIRLAREAYNEMDQLGNTRMSFSYFDAKNQATAQEQIAVLKDKDSTEEQKKAARELLDKTLKDQEEIVGQYKRRSQNAMQAMVKAAIGMDGVDVSAIDVDKVLRLDVSAVGDDQKAQLSKQYKDFEKEYNRLKAKYTTYETVGSGINVHTVSTTDTSALGKAISPVLGKYQDAIQYNAILVKKSDEWLEKLIAVSSAAESADRNLSSMTKAANRASQSGTDGGNTPKEEPKKDSLAWYDSQIAELNKKLINTADAQVKSTIRAIINELESKKLELQIETSGNSLEAINIQLSDLNKKLITETDMQARITIQAAINQLEQKKVNIKMVVEKHVFTIEHGDQKDGKLPNPIKPTYDDKVPTHGKDGKKYKLPKQKPAFNKKDIKLNQDYQESLAAIGDTMGSLSGLFDSNTASVLQWGLSLLTTIGNAIPKILEMSNANEIEAISAQRSAVANTTAASGEVLKAHAGIPFVGIALGLAGVAAIIAAMASMPKFAMGGIVPGASFTGDRVPALLNSGEMILNGGQQSNLFKMLNRGVYGGISASMINPLSQYAPISHNIVQSESVREIKVSGILRAKGCDLEASLTNYTHKKSKVR